MFCLSALLKLLIAYTMPRILEQLIYYEKPSKSSFTSGLSSMTAIITRFT
jgi:hypothetical protein